MLQNVKRQFCRLKTILGSTYKIESTSTKKATKYVIISKYFHLFYACASYSTFFVIVVLDDFK